jgi:hypothetical protein
MRDVKDIVRTAKVDTVAHSVLQQLAVSGTQEVEMSPLKMALVTFAETFFGEGKHVPNVKDLPPEIQACAPSEMSTADVVMKILGLYDYTLRSAIVDSIEREETSAARIRNMFVNAGVQTPTTTPTPPKIPQEARNEPKEVWEQGVDKFVAYLQFARDNHVSDSDGKKAIDAAIADIKKKAIARKKKVL